jgi:hypothetical protein
VANQEHVRTLLAWLDTAITEMQRCPAPRDGKPDPRRAPVRVVQVNRAHLSIRTAVVTHAALAVFYNDAESIPVFTETFLGAGRVWQIPVRGQRVRVEKAPVLSLALVQSVLQRARGWHDSDDPLAYIAAQCRYMARDQADEEAAPDNTVPLEEVVDTPAEAGASAVTVERVYSFDAFKDEARRRGLLKVIAYIEGVEAGLREGIGYRDMHRWVRRRMGWNKFQAADVRRQFELRDAAVGLVLRGLVSEASVTWFWETLYAGERGRGRGAYAQRPQDR